MSALDSLKKALLTLSPEGERGLEGLVAHALSSLMSRYFRLARAGRQHGRDGAAAPGAFDVFFETKLYSKRSPSTEELQAKLMSAVNAHGPILDVWALAATVPIGENAVAELDTTADRCGVTLVVIDWTNHPIPPLAVLLAGARGAVTEWLRPIRSAGLRQRVEHALGEITGYPSFQATLDQLKIELSSETVGLGAAREKNTRWLQSRFANRREARQVFGQFLAPTDQTFPAIRRERLVQDLAAALTSACDPMSLIAVIGEEGSGKTWLVATTRLSLTDKPILLIYTSGHSFGEFDLSNPMRLLSRLLAEQTGGSRSDEALDRWTRRLENWGKRPGGEPPRIILALDGLNERESLPWIRLIDKLADIAPGIGLRLVVTSRIAFYQNHLKPRLCAYSIAEITVGLLSDEELAVGLVRVGRKLDEVETGLREFIRNPRIFSIAASLLDQLSIRELTRERLLFEYWRKRLEECGDRIRHGDGDMRQLLISHAREVREQIRLSGKAHVPSFRRDTWKTHSGLAQRRADPSIDDELTEVEEGRFFEPDPDMQGNYRLRSEALPFALALLLLHELKLANNDGENVAMRMDEVLDPIRGFDLAADILLAAVGIACVDHTSNDDLIAALIYAVVCQQNIGESSIERLSLYVPSCPRAFIKAAEYLWSRSPGYHGHRDWITQLLFQHRYHPAVQHDLDAAIPRWLGLWSREPEDRYHHVMSASEREKAQLEHERHSKETSKRLSALTLAERKILALFGQETPDSALPSIDSLAVSLLAGRSLAPFADAIVTWQLTGVLTDMFRSSYEMTWTIRLNPIDAYKTAEALSKKVAALEAEGVSEVGLRTVMAIYGITGRPQDAAEAQRLWMSWEGRPELRGWRLVENFCDSDPLDPKSDDPTNIDRAISRIRAIQVAEVRMSMFMGISDHDIDMLTPGLARFRPGPLIEKLRELCCNVRMRKEVPLRQLSLYLPELTPLISRPEIKAIRDIYEYLVRSGDPLATEQHGFVAQYLLLSSLPHLDGIEQLRLLLSLPQQVNVVLLVLHPHFKEILPEQLEEYLIRFGTGANNQDLVRLRRTLFFAATGKTPLTERARDVVILSFSHMDELVRMSAFEVAAKTKDVQALEALVASNWSAGRLDKQSMEAFYGSRALVATLDTVNSVETLSRLTPMHQSAVTNRLSGSTLRAFALGMEERLRSAFGLPTNISPDIPLQREIGSPMMPAAEFPFWNVRDEDEESNDPVSALKDVMSIQAVEKKWRERNERGRAAMDAYISGLRDQGADWLVDPVHINSLRAIAARQLDTFGDILKLVEGAGDDNLPPVLNFAFCLAIVLSDTESERAAIMISRLDELWPHVRFLIGPAGIPFDRLALWLCTDSPSMNEIRGNRLRTAGNDKMLATELLCAEYAGKRGVVLAYIETLLSSDHPSDIARAITLAGFCDFDDRIGGLFGNTRFAYGFLEDAARKAREAYERNIWARHWFLMAREADSPAEYWRFSELMIKSADARFVLWFPGPPENMGKPFSDFHILLKRRLKERAKKRAQERRDTLFGIQSPSNHLLTAIGLLRST